MDPATVRTEDLVRSELFAIRRTPHAGLGAFALRRLPPGTILHSTGRPCASVINRPYRREVCAWCFAYDRGKEWRVRDSHVGFAFCCEACADAWRQEEGEVGVEAWRCVEEGLLKGKKGLCADKFVPDNATPPTEEEIERAWKTAADEVGLLICAGRSSSSSASPRPPSKATRRAMQAALQDGPPAPDTLAFLLSGTLTAGTRPERWTQMLALTPDLRPYSSREDLEEHIKTYLHLLCLLPPTLLPITTPQTLLDLARRDSCNSFGLRSVDDGGDEFFGYGTWPSASFFNHSCQPNVAKRRLGAGWTFETEKEVEEGEELCISYLGGAERELDTSERRRRLREGWHFECQCQKCGGQVPVSENGVVHIHGPEAQGL